MNLFTSVQEDSHTSWIENGTMRGTTQRKKKIQKRAKKVARKKLAEKKAAQAKKAAEAEQAKAARKTAQDAEVRARANRKLGGKYLPRLVEAVGQLRSRLANADIILIPEVTLKPIRQALVTAVDMMNNLDLAAKGGAPVKATDKLRQLKC